MGDIDDVATQGMHSVDRIEVTLTVPSVEDTIAWYERVLGWVGHCDAFDHEGRCIFGSVSCGTALVGGEGAFVGFNLSRASVEGDDETTEDGCCGASAWIFVDDVDQVYTRVVDSGVTAEAPPRNQPWGGRVFSLRDRNGFKLTFVEMTEA